MCSSSGPRVSAVLGVFLYTHMHCRLFGSFPPQQSDHASNATTMSALTWTIVDFNEHLPKGSTLSAGPDVASTQRVSTPLHQRHLNPWQAEEAGGQCWRACSKGV